MKPRQTASQSRTVAVNKLSHRQIVAQILVGQLTAENVSDQRHRELCDAVGQLQEAVTPPERPTALQALEQLYYTCQSHRAKFLEGPRPTGSAIVHQHGSYVRGIAAIAAYHRHWLRPLADWKFRTHNARRQFDSLVDHLFVAYPAPHFFYDVWLQRELAKAAPEQKAFIHVGAGHNLRQAELPLPYTTRMAHHFRNAPRNYSFRQALRWGQVGGLGGDTTLAQAVAQTFLGTDFRHHIFWQSVIAWFIQHPMFDRNLFSVVVDYLNAQKFGFGNPVRLQVGPNGGRREHVDPAKQPHLSMKGRTPESLLKAINRWHRGLHSLRGQKQTHWPHAKIPELDLLEGEKSPARWTIRQLLSSHELIDEGREMNHCVASYVSSCVRGQTSIWSMSRWQQGRVQRALTVEVALQNLVIVQARGRANRLATTAELSILRRWASVAGLCLPTSVV